MQHRKFAVFNKVKFEHFNIYCCRWYLYLNTVSNSLYEFTINNGGD